MKKDTAYYGSLLEKFFNNELPVEQLDELLDWMRDDPAAYEEILDNPEKQGQLMACAYSMDLPEALSRKMHDRLINAMAAARTKEKRYGCYSAASQFPA